MVAWSTGCNPRSWPTRATELPTQAAPREGGLWRVILRAAYWLTAGRQNEAAALRLVIERPAGPAAGWGGALLRMSADDCRAMLSALSAASALAFRSEAASASVCPRPLATASAFPQFPQCIWQGLPPASCWRGRRRRLVRCLGELVRVLLRACGRG
jgi:hypothetical protein